MHPRNIVTLLTIIAGPVVFLQGAILWIQTIPPTYQAAPEIRLNQNGDCQARVYVVETPVMTYSSVQAVVDDPDAGGHVVKVAGTCAGVESQGGLTQTVYIAKSLTIPRRIYFHKLEWL